MICGKMIFNIFIFSVVVFFGVFAPAFILWGGDIYNYDSVKISSLVTVIFIGVVSGVFFSKVLRYPGVKPLVYLLPCMTASYFLGLVFLMLFRLPYSRSFFLFSFACFFIIGWGYYFVSRRGVKLCFGIIKSNVSDDIYKLSDVNWVVVDEPDFERINKLPCLDGVVFDIKDEVEFKRWESFITLCALNHIPVYDFSRVKESITGRVTIGRIFDEQLLMFSPSLTYLFLKRAFDVGVCVILSPVVLLLFFVLFFLIKLESAGPVFFKQKRIGVANKEFTIYKFRTMRVDSNGDVSKFAELHDDRITSVGRFLRKTRIDELPQIFNVLIGDMSLIGPRPEQVAFVHSFSEKISSYDLRHIVKPGITGWAQVMHGYAAGEVDTKIKLEHDLYYIKNISLWLDMLIFFKTVRVVFTGYGAR